MSDFYEVVDLTANIESILKRYPFSIGIFRELLQNSDDAGATKQAFILDLRTHASDRLADEKLSVLQGASLLACNDTAFTEKDWSALRSINGSSKKTDTSTIGKYGIGMRSGYHLTDNIEVYSAGSLVIFDPHRTLIPEGGKKWDTTSLQERSPDQLSPFRGLPILDTVVRLPLRTPGHHSRLSTKVPRPDEIRTLMQQFVEDELAMVLLFLSHVEEIEILEIDDDCQTLIGRCQINREATPREDNGDLLIAEQVYSSVAIITVEQFDAGGQSTSSKSQAWRVLHASFSKQSCIDALRDRLGRDTDYDVVVDVDSEKLCPADGSPVAIAVPLASKPLVNGRLFTYLPLPLATGFPCHIHALFALTDSRDHLRNAGEKVLDHTRDKVLIEWNRVLFENFIPKTWALSLQNLRQRAERSDLYDVWPSLQHQASSGESIYWHRMPAQVLQAILDRDLAVWPTFSSTPPAYTKLSAVIVASDQTPRSALESLVSAGLKIVQPPTYIFDMIEKAKLHHGDSAKILTPRTAHAALLPVSSDLPALSASDKEAILSYLFLSNELSLLGELPIIPTVSGQDTMLHTTSQWRHTLLNKEEAELFGSHDANAIALDRLPSLISAALCRNGEASLNVARMDCKRVLEYLHQELDGVLPRACEERAADDTIRWLFRFWKWLPQWPLRIELAAAAKPLALLVANDGRLRVLDEGIFLGSELDATLREILEKLGLHFLHPSFPPSAVSVIDRKIILDPFNAPNILDNVQTGDASRPSFSDGEIQLLGTHLASCLVRAGRLSTEHKSLLRSLPVYRLFSSVGTSAGWELRTSLASIPITSRIYRISGAKDVLLPIIPNAVFVSASGWEGDLLEAIDLQSAARVLKASDVVTLCIKTLVEQSPAWQLAFLEHLAARPHLLSYSDKGILRKSPFIAVGHGISRRPPEDVVDTDSPIATLVRVDEERYPASCDAGIYHRMMDPLRSLGLLRNCLSVDFVGDRIQYISKLSKSSAEDADKLARSLIKMIADTSFDCSHLRLNDTVEWLPTPRGMCSPSACRDRSCRQLVDRVMPILDMEISSALRQALGWSMPVPIDVLMSQMKAVVLEEHNAEYLYRLIREFGNRLSDFSTHLGTLQNIVQDHAWIPISWEPIRIATTSQAVFSREADGLPGFWTIPSDLVALKGVKSLLLKMGCNEKPSTTAILQRIADEKKKEPRCNLRQVVRLLDAIGHLPENHNQELIPVFVPDVRGYLRRSDEVYYDDLGARALELALPAGFYKMHTLITDDIATRLGIRSLSSWHLGHLDADEDMHEDLTTRIQGVLKSYSITQSFNEFLANAADANASAFGIVFDESQHDNVSKPVFMTDEMKRICGGDALIIHNDSLFQEKDWKGIRHVGVGGKQGDMDTIGRFGLGSLVMFHFSEVPMIVSGEFVLFLDPSTKYLPPEGHRKRSALRLPLSKLQSLYNGHLSRLYGIFGFSADKEFYDGTLFYLPLRTNSHPKRGNLSAHTVTPLSLQNLIRDYEADAPSSLLFLGVKHVSAHWRKSSGVVEGLWAITAERGDVHTEEDFRCHDVVMAHKDSLPKSQDQVWRVASMRFCAEDVPPELQGLVIKHQLKILDVGLAVVISPSITMPTRPRFFSKLPLPVYTSLPLHIHASFILADDRRSIRFDDNGQSVLEAVFNRWLLSSRIPLLYFWFLEQWPSATSNSNLFPAAKVPGSDIKDPLSQVVVNGFYELLPATSRNVFHSASGKRLQPTDAVFLTSHILPVASSSMLLALKPDELVEFPSTTYIKALKTDDRLKWVKSEYVCQVIRRNRTSFLNAFTSPKLNVSGVQEILDGIQEDLDPSHLAGLPLLPLANDTLADINDSSHTMIYASTLHDRRRPWPLFPSDRFVHPDFRVENILGRGLNVSEFDGPAVAEFVKSRLPKSISPIMDINKKGAAWIQSFWQCLDIPKTSIEHISSLALVKTTHAGRYVSMEYCQTDAVLVIPMNHRDAEYECTEGLRKMGALFVRLDDMPPPLRELLGSVPFNFVEVLKFVAWKCNSLEDEVNSIPQLFSRLFENECRQFSLWARREIQTCIVDTSLGLRSLICRLPIWPAACANVVKLRALRDRDVQILPWMFELEHVVPFLQGSRCYYTSVPLSVLTQLELEVKPMTVPVILLYLNDLKVLTPGDVSLYQQFLDRLFLHCQSQLSDVTSIRVPNSSRAMVNSDTLYAGRTVNAFRDIFSSHSQYLIHPDFVGYEKKLESFGLKSKLDFTTFMTCVQTWCRSGRFDNNRRQQAAALYRWYQDLPMEIGAHQYKWSQLKNYDFIPRRQSLPRYGLTNILTHRIVKSLPNIISPSNVLRPEHEAIAWTQRGLFDVVPHERLFLADLSLGVPTVEEVVEHLLVLALCAAEEFSGNGEVLRDLTQTYEWLNQRSKKAGDILLNYTDKDLFLNVDDPENGPWRFASASQLIFNAPDEDDRQSVRTFLMPFKNLLLAANAHEIKQLVAPPVEWQSPNDLFSRLRLAINEQRLKGQLTDALLVSTDGSELPVHRSFLAASVKHFRDLFCDSGYAESSSSASPDDPVRILVEETGAIIQTIVDFIYTGRPTIKDEHDQGELLSVLKLAHLWGIADLYAEIESMLVATITPGTFADLHRDAKLLEAQVLQQHCETYAKEHWQVFRDLGIATDL
ncbi:hypothetical protein IEO21_04696 [Rhodonia placenta]|uniref:BTB domain-containing protein n=1 Tax=Rhodonia placenta TaxID=104341 RepID=A0A8H7U2S2_9APHY|nr:hypothetical protein IEO21_04696 [Postia placenta]